MEMEPSLFTLKFRRLRGDMIKVYKFLNNIYMTLYDSSMSWSNSVPISCNSSSGGNKFKLSNHTFHYDLRKYPLLLGLFIFGIAYPIMLWMWVLFNYLKVD